MSKGCKGFVQVYSNGDVQGRYNSSSGGSSKVDRSVAGRGSGGAEPAEHRPAQRISVESNAVRVWSTQGFHLEEPRWSMLI